MISLEANIAGERVFLLCVRHAKFLALEDQAASLKGDLDALRKESAVLFEDIMKSVFGESKKP